MKQYQKPALYALSLSANDALCYGCGVKTSTDYALSQMIFILYPQLDTDNNGLLSKSEAVGLFSTPEADCELKFDYEGYCKFTAADESKIFTS